MMHLFFISLVVASGVNILLDPILIFGYFGFPALGTAGAGIATVTGQTVAAFVAMELNLKKNREIPIRYTIKPSGKAIRDILRVGIPTMIMQSISSGVAMLANIILVSFSSTAVAVLGVCTKIQNMVVIVPHGINNVLIPIIAYNYGAGKRERIRQAFLWAMIFSIGFTACAALLLILFPQHILIWFNASENMLAVGTSALRMISAATLLSVYALILCAVFQAMGDGNAGMYLTVARQAIFVLPMLFILSKMNDVAIVWLAYPSAELMGVAMSVLMQRKTGFLR